MTFREEMERRGYQIKARDDKKLAIFHRIQKAESVIIFDHTCKMMLGYIAPKDVFVDLDDMSKIYGLFTRLQEDIEVFSKLSNYEVIK